jgi:4-amino-4-deoxy-L-arabinose transferase-like glycosyltransferase
MRRQCSAFSRAGEERCCELSTVIAQPKIESKATHSSSVIASLAVLLFVLIVFLGSAFSPAILDDADATHAEAAREMLVRGDYVTLHVNGIRYLEKAPLPYWTVAFFYRTLGVSEFATRLPNVLAVLLTALLAMTWGRRAFGPRAGTYAGLFVVSTVGYYLFTRILIPEAILSLFIAAAFSLFASTLEDGEPWQWYGIYVCVALAVLTKGLIGIVFVGGPIFFYLLLSGEWRRWREFRLASGTLLMLAIAAPWHVLASVRNAHFAWFYFVNEHFMRFLGKRIPKDYNKLPNNLYWVLHLVWLFPWSLYLPLAVRELKTHSVSNRARVGESFPGLGMSFAARTRMLCWLWAGMILVFFAVSTNQEYYTFPAYFPVVMLLAAAIAGAEESANGRRWLIASSGVLAAIGLAAGGTLIAGLWASRHIPYVADIGTVLAQHQLDTDTLSMSHMLDLTGESFAALRLPAAMAVVALVAGFVTAFWLRLRRRDYAATWTTACAMVLFFLAAHVALVRFEPTLSSKTLAMSIAQQVRPEDEVMIYGDQAYGSSLLFYLRRPILLVNGRSTSMWFGSTYPDAPHIYLDDADLVREWHSGRRVFLFVPPQHREEVEALLHPAQWVLAEVSGKVVHSNQR